MSAAVEPRVAATTLLLLKEYDRWRYQEARRKLPIIEIALKTGEKSFSSFLMNSHRNNKDVTAKLHQGK